MTRPYRMIATCRCSTGECPCERRKGGILGLARVRTSDGKIARTIRIGDEDAHATGSRTAGGLPIYETRKE